MVVIAVKTFHNSNEGRTREPKAILELRQDNNPRQFLSWQKLRTDCVLTMKDSLFTICLTIIGTHVSPLINHTWTTYKDGPYYG